MARKHALLVLVLISAMGAGPVFAQSTAEVNGNLDTLFGGHAGIHGGEC